MRCDLLVTSFKKCLYKKQIELADSIAIIESINKNKISAFDTVFFSKYKEKQSFTAIRRIFGVK